MERGEERQTSGDFIPATLHAKPKAVSSDNLLKGECLGGVVREVSLNWSKIGEGIDRT